MTSPIKPNSGKATKSEKTNTIKKASVSQTSSSDKRPQPQLPKHYYKKSHTPKPLEAMDVREFVRMPIPNPDPLMGNWLLCQGLCMIHGARGEGKTWLAFAIACAVAAGRNLFGWMCKKPRKVVYLDGEMSSRMFQSRIKEIPKHMRPAAEMLKLVTPDFQPGALPDLSNREEQELINAAIDDDTDLVIVDNLSSWSKSGREDSDTWAPIAEWALRHRSEGRSIIFVHHSGKAGTQRGTSRREDLLDVVLALKKPPNSSPGEGACFEIRFEKNRHLVGADVEPILVRLVKDSDGKNDWEWEPVQDNPSERLAQISKLKKKGLNQAQIAKKLGVNRSTISRDLKEAES